MKWNNYILHLSIMCYSIAVLNVVYDFCQMHKKMLLVIWQSHQVHDMRAFLVLVMCLVKFVSC